MKKLLLPLLASIAIAVPSVVMAVDHEKPMGKEMPMKGDMPMKKDMPMKPHSHMEEKTGVPQGAGKSPKMDKADTKVQENATPEKDKHYHPRDGK